jgi:F0F1-type ATP synthase delta subunit
MSAVALEPGHKDAIIKKIEAATKKTVEAEECLDAKLLAGVKVEYEGYVMDGTVQGNYEKLREQLIFDLLKQS